MESTMPARRRLLLGMLVCFSLAAGIGTSGRGLAARTLTEDALGNAERTIEQRQPANPLLERYGVAVVEGSAEQVVTLGFTWYTQCCDPERELPEGTKSPRFAPIDPVWSTDTVRDLAKRFPGTYWF